MTTARPRQPRRRLQGLRRPRHCPRPARRGAGPRDRRAPSSPVVGARHRRRRPRHAAQLAGLAGAFADGAAEAGADVVMIGLASTDQLYFASGHLGHPGAMFTASHNPAQYNGIKMCRAGAQPIGMETGLAEIRDAVVARRRRRSRDRPGTITQHDVLEAYAAHLLSLAPVAGRRLKVVVDAGNGMAGLHRARGLRARSASEQVELVPMYFELDGTFPQPRGQPDRAGEPRRPPGRGSSPRAPTSAWPSTATPTAASWSTSAAGAVSPVDADRADRRPRAGQASPGATVIHNLITSRAVPEIVTELGGTPGAHPGRALLHQGDDGRDRRDLRRRAQRPLLLPRLLARRLRDARRAARARRARRDRPAAVGAARRLRALRRQRRDQLRPSPTRPRSTADDRGGVRRPRRASRSTTSTASPSPPTTGGSTCARPTPSRCCGSTPRAATRPPWPGSATTSSP